MATLLQKVNNTTRKALGSVGRPAAVGAAAGFGANALGQRFDFELLDSNMTCAAIGCGTALAVEGVLYFWGDDTSIQLANGQHLIDTLVKDATIKNAEDLRKAVTGLDEALSEALMTLILVERAGKALANPPVEEPVAAPVAVKPLNARKQTEDNGVLDAVVEAAAS